MTYTVTFGRDATEIEFDDKDEAIDLLRRLPVTVCGEVRDENGVQWAVRQG